MVLTGGISLWVGPDRARKLEQVRRVALELTVQALDLHRLDGGAMDPVSLMRWCRQQPAVSPLRLIVVDEAHRLDRACVEALVEQAAVIAKNARVILLVEAELPARHPLSQVGESPTLRFAKRNMGDEPLVAVAQFPGRGEVRAAKPFALTDALGARDLPGAFAALQEQMAVGKEPLELVGLVGWQLGRWVTARRLLDEGKGMEGIASTTGWRLWYTQRLCGEVAHRPLRSLQRLLERCWQLDVDAKSGRLLPQMAVEQLVAEVCVTQ
jgi:DNA polymerase III delta subunit